jgi:hypothetical protein
MRMPVRAEIVLLTFWLPAILYLPANAQGQNMEVGRGVICDTRSMPSALPRSVQGEIPKSRFGLSTMRSKMAGLVALHPCCLPAASRLLRCP